MLKNDTLKNGTSRVALYGSAPRAEPPEEWKPELPPKGPTTPQNPVNGIPPTSDYENAKKFTPDQPATKSWPKERTTMWRVRTFEWMNSDEHQG